MCTHISSTSGLNVWQLVGIWDETLKENWGVRCLHLHYWVELWKAFCAFEILPCQSVLILAHTFRRHCTGHPSSCHCFAAGQPDTNLDTSPCTVYLLWICAKTKSWLLLQHWLDPAYLRPHPLVWLWSSQCWGEARGWLPSQNIIPASVTPKQQWLSKTSWNVLPTYVQQWQSQWQGMSTQSQGSCETVNYRDLCRCCLWTWCFP